MRKIAVITGIRADYGIIYPVIKEIQKHRDLKLELIVAGTHLSHEFGYTIKEIENDKFKVAAKVDMLLSDNTGARMGKSIGVGILGFTQTFEILKPDITLLIGDREEMLAAAVASLCMDIPVAHIHGGEIGTGGHIDESVRHAITKFAHIHFAVTKKSAERINRLGEENWRVHFVGAPFMDNIKQKRFTGSNELKKKIDLDLSEPLIVVIQHPLTLESKNSKTHMQITMEAVAHFRLPTIVIYPNADAGSQDIIQVIKQYERYPYIKVFKNFTPRDYLGILKIAGVVVGNSSSGIIETPAFGLPAVNIGIRQLGREMSENIINVGYDKKEIENAIRQSLFNEAFRVKAKNCQNFYGTGGSSQKIVKILADITLDSKLLHKKMTF